MCDSGHDIAAWMISILREIPQFEITRPEEHQVKTVLPFRPYLYLSYVPGLLMVFIIVLVAACTTGCGTRGSNPPAPVLSGNTSVTVLLSSTANDQLSQYEISFNSVSLTSKSGKTVDLFTTSQNTEFIHLNGQAEALLTVSIPQDIYTSATASIGPANFTCATLIPATGGLDISMFAYGYVPSNQVTVNVPTPITVTGAGMGLKLDMQVSPSATLPSSCYTTDLEPWSINPTFDLTPVSFSSPVVEPLLDGRITSLNPADNTFTIALAGGVRMPGASGDGQILTVKTSNSTVYQGVNGLSLLIVGTFVDMDATIQSDGSQLATRIAVEDANTTSMTVSTGPVLQTNTAWPVLVELSRQNQGYLTDAGLFPIGSYFSFGSAAFQILGRFANLQSLPFVPSFDASNVFAGQNVYITTQAITWGYPPTYFPLTTVTLMPQTINGTITGISTEGSFTVYTVMLAAYDLIPTLAVQQGQTTVLNDPSTVLIYVDKTTSMLNKQPLALGSVMRCGGMLFNDNGTMRMDCGQVNDGVAVQAGTQAPEVAGSAHLPQHSVAVHRYLRHPVASK